MTWESHTARPFQVVLWAPGLIEIRFAVSEEMVLRSCPPVNRELSATVALANGHVENRNSGEQDNENTKCPQATLRVNERIQ